MLRQPRACPTTRSSCRGDSCCSRARRGRRSARFWPRSARAEEDDPGAFRLENEAKRFLRAPLVIAVISRVVKNPAAPDWEQILSAGAACQNSIVAATALGYGAQWITEWCGYSQGVRKALRLADNERVAGFVYIGTPKEKPEERERPNLAEIVASWRP